jgi:hypothetical protein
MSPSIAAQLFADELTDEAVRTFEDAAAAPAP